MFRKIEAYVRHERLEEVRQALIEIGIPAMDTVEALGHGRQTDIKLAGRHSCGFLRNLKNLKNLKSLRNILVRDVRPRKDGCTSLHSV
jgi:nitrogen regulatory protein PII